MLRLPTFTYMTPETVQEAVALKAEHGADAMFVAGGTDLYPNMKRRQQEPGVVIAVGHLAELNGIRLEADARVRIGAGETLTAVAGDAMLQERYAALTHAAGEVSTPHLRNMGTIGGNLCLDTRCNYYDQTYEWRKAISFCMKKDGEICWVAPSSPRCWAVNSSDTAPVAVALGAEIEVAGPGGTRTVPAAEFYRNDGIDYLSKGPNDLVTCIHLPAADGWRASYVKLRRRGSFDFPVLGVAAWLRLGADGTVAEARIILGAVASYPLPVAAAAEAIVGRPLDDESIAAAADAAFRPAKPMDNTDFQLSWRKEMVRPYVTRALSQLT